MVLGDGVRRDVAKVWEAERHRLRDAFIASDTTKIYLSRWRDVPGEAGKIHKNAQAARQHIHSGRVFLPGHGEPDVGRDHMTGSQLSPWPLVRRGDQEHPGGTDRHIRRSARDGLAGRAGGRT
jgi:hypothetical protein